MRIAIVGTGISGLVAAHLLSERHDVTVFEADDRPGGHTNTVRVDLPDASVDVDTGFLVYNDRTYPNFIRLLERLGVATQASDMSFGVQDERTGIEWRATSLSTVLAQPSNALRPDFVRMLVDIARFNRIGRRILTDPPPLSVTLEDVLAGGRWSEGFRSWYLVPIGSSIWSADPTTFLRMPAYTFCRFFERHGLLAFGDQPQWRTVTGGARNYVDAILDPLRAEGRLRLGSPVDKVRRSDGGVELVGAAFGAESFDHVVLAGHAPQMLGLLSDADRLEREVLGALRTQPNRATLHTDASVMPRARRAWASWNYHRTDPEHDSATLTYYLNSLQSLDSDHPVFVTLNRDDVIDPDKVVASFDYAHPVVDGSSVAARARHDELNGRRNTWYAGAYWGSGFHEDGVVSALAACRALGADL